MIHNTTETAATTPHRTDGSSDKENPAATTASLPSAFWKQIPWRRVLFLLLIVGLIYLVWHNRKEAMEIGRTMRAADYRWLGVAALLQCAYFAMYSEMYRWAFRTVQIPGAPFSMLPTLLGSLVVGMVAPAWSAAGTAIFVDDAIRRGQTPARAATATLLAHTLDFLGFSIVLIAGLITLRLRGELNQVVLIPAGIFFLFTFSMVTVLVLGQSRPMWVSGLLSYLQRQLAAFFIALKRPVPINDTWAEETTREFGEAACSVREYPARAIFSVLSALTAHLVSALCLYCLFLAFNQRVTVGPLVAGYAVVILATIVSPIPGGVGVAETAMTKTFEALGVGGGEGFSIALSFRGLNFWLPLAAGFFVVSQMRSFRSGGGKKKPESVVETATKIVEAGSITTKPER